MPFRNMSLDDFARHVGMEVAEVVRLADRGRLPGHKIGGQWRFNRAKVTEWLQQEIHTFDQDRLAALERAMGGPQASAADDTMIVTDLISPEGVNLEIRANTKPSVLRELVNLAEKTGLLYDADGLLEALEQREAMCSTALPNGVAIPHPRQPMPYASSEPLICVARSTRGIPFGGGYAGLTNLFFLICCHDDRQHLRVLARLMRILDGNTIEALLAAATNDELLELLINRETKVLEQTERE